MNRTSAKIISVVIAFVMTVALAVPSFADSLGSYKDPEITITNGNVDGYNAYGTEIAYQIKLFGDGAMKIKVGATNIDFEDFTAKSDGTYIYKGTYKLKYSTELKFLVKDFHQAGGTEYTKTFDLKVDSTVPVLKVSSIANNYGILNFAILSIVATDNCGLAKIEVNGETIADADDIKGARVYTAIHDLISYGKYVITVTDIAGNITVGYSEFSKDGSEVSTTVPTLPSSPSITLPTNPYLLGTSNPMFYYYYLQSTGDIDSADYPTWLYYLSTMKPSDGTQTTDNTNNWLLYYLLAGDKTDVKNDQFLYYLLNGGNFNNFNGVNGYIWYYLLSDKDKELDPALFYTLISGNLASDLTNTNINTNFLAYQYYYGAALGYVDGSAIKTAVKDGDVSMKAPEIKDARFVSYKWQKLTNGIWRDITGGTGNSITVTPAVGDCFRVVLSSEYYYTDKISDTLTITQALLDGTTPTPDPDDDDDDDEDDDYEKITPDDITIKNVINNYVRIKVGTNFLLKPNILNGYWLYDNTMLTGTNTAVSIFTALKAGYTYLSYVAFDEHGNFATKNLLVEIYE